MAERKSREELLDLAYDEARSAQIKRPDLFVWQMFRESGFDQDKEGLAGELGVAQFTWELAKGLPAPKGYRPGEDWRLDPEASLWQAAQLMKKYLNKYGGRWDYALAEWNAGADDAKPQDRPGETREYIWFVTGLTHADVGFGETLIDEGPKPERPTLESLEEAPWVPPPQSKVEGLAGGDPDPIDAWRNYEDYLILKGDTLSGIAAKLSVPMAEIARANDIKPPYLIHAGRWLRIPRPWASSFTTRGPVGETSPKDSPAQAMANVALPIAAPWTDSAPPEPPATAPAAEAPKVVVEKGRSDMAPQFKDPAGNVLAPGSREIKYFGGDTSRPVIDKGDGSFLTPGNPKDAQWTADRIDEGKKEGLDTEGWWEGNPVSIQSAINQARIKKQAAPPPAAPAPVKTAAKAEAVVVKDDWKQEIEREKLQLQREAQEDERRLAWFKAVSTLRGPRNWTSYWNSLRGGPDGPLPVWLTKLGEGETLPAYGPVEKTPSEEAWARLQAQRALPGWVRQLARSAWPDWKEETAWQTPAPQQVGLKQWTNLLPSEREGLQGIVERTGGYAADWLDAMQRSWPQWGRAPRTRFPR